MENDLILKGLITGFIIGAGSVLTIFALFKFILEQRETYGKQKPNNKDNDYEGGGYDM